MNNRQFYGESDCFEIGDGAFQYVDLGVQVLRDGLEDQHVGEEGGELSIQLHLGVPDEVQHPLEQLNSVYISEMLVLDLAEQVFEILVVLLVILGGLFDDLLALVEGEGVDHLGTVFRLLHDETLDEVDEVGPILLLHLDHHSYVDEGDLHLLIELLLQPVVLLVLLSALQVQLPEQFRLETPGDQFHLHPLVDSLEKVLQVVDGISRLLFYPDQDVAAVAVSMDEIMLHEHFKKGGDSDTSDDPVECSLLLLVVGDGFALHEGLYKHTGAGGLLVGDRKVHFFVVFEHLIEDSEVSGLVVEVDLLGEGLFEGVLTDRNFESSRNVRKCPTDEEQQVDVPLNVLLYSGMTHLDGYLLSLVSSLVYLAD